MKRKELLEKLEVMNSKNRLSLDDINYLSIESNRKYVIYDSMNRTTEDNITWSMDNPSVFINCDTLEIEKEMPVFCDTFDDFGEVYFFRVIDDKTDIVFFYGDLNGNCIYVKVILQRAVFMMEEELVIAFNIDVEKD